MKNAAAIKAPFKNLFSGLRIAFCSLFVILLGSAKDGISALRSSLLTLRLCLQELAIGVLEGLSLPRVRCRLAADFVSLVLCGAALAVFCSSVEGGLDLYMSIFIPLVFVCAAFLVFTETLGGPRVYAICTVLLILVGVALQVLLLLPAAEAEVVSANELVVFAVLGLVFSAAVLPVLIYLVRCAPRRTALRLVLAATVAVYAALFVFGSRVNGTKAWIIIGGLSMQLTELTKFLGIVGFALIFTDEGRGPAARLRSAVVVLCMHAVCLFLVNELGTLIVLGAVFFIMAFVYQPKLKPLLLVALAALVCAVAALLFCRVCYETVSGAEAEYGRVVNLGAQIYEKVSLRVNVLLKPESVDANGGGYQAARAREAIILSEWLGTTFDVHVPVVESDYIFIYVVLKMGVLFAVIVLLMLLLMLTHGVCCALGADRGAESALGVGFVTVIVMQSLLSAMSSAGIIPTVGIPFAFLSQGGTQTIFNYAMSFFVIYAGRQKLCPTEEDAPAAAERREVLCRKKQ